VRSGVVGDYRSAPSNVCCSRDRRFEYGGSLKLSMKAFCCGLPRLLRPPQDRPAWELRVVIGDALAGLLRDTNKGIEFARDPRAGQ
jgi:hypothetical protein